MPLVDNAESLLDESDLVFVDPPGTGYSQAIAPHMNKDFWGVQVDANVLFQFIKRYVNLNQRQSSPKYVYGESYGGGIRVPILSKMMTEAGSGAYDPEAPPLSQESVQSAVDQKLRKKFNEAARAQTV